MSFPFDDYDGLDCDWDSRKKLKEKRWNEDDDNGDDVDEEILLTVTKWKQQNFGFLLFGDGIESIAFMAESNAILQ